MGRFPILNGEPDDGLVWLDRAIELSPSFAKSHYSRSMIHALSGRAADCRAGLDLATALSPLDPLLGPIRGFRSISYIIDGDLEAAADWGIRAAQTSNAHFIVVMGAVIACELAGQRARAAHWMAVLRDHRPDARTSHFLNALPFVDPAFRAGATAALRSAGLPD